MRPENPRWPLDVNTVLVGLIRDMSSHLFRLPNIHNMCVIFGCREDGSLLWEEPIDLKGGVLCFEKQELSGHLHVLVHSDYTLISSVIRFPLTLFPLSKGKEMLQENNKNNTRPGQWWHSKFQASHIFLISVPVLMTTKGSLLLHSNLLTINVLM